MMNTFVVLFDFMSRFGEEMTPEELLEDHNQIVEMMKSIGAIKLSPAAFLLETHMSAETVGSDLTAYIDRGEAVYVFSVHLPGDWNAFGDKDVLSKIEELCARRTQDSEPAPEEEPFEITRDQ